MNSSLRCNCSLFLLIAVLCSATVLAFSPPPPAILGLGVLFRAPGGMKTAPSLGENDVLMEAADFFTDAFWASKVGGTVKELQPRQRSSLLNQQINEFRRRYKGASGTQEAELLVTKNRKGNVMGCCGIEVDNIPEGGTQGRIRTKAPLMSNVAVGKQFRRRGIAEEMVFEAENLARKEWGYDEVYLYVEQRNKAAVRLYQKLGYRKLWADETATALMPLVGGGMEQVTTTLLCMRKSLKQRGVFGLRLPF